MKTSARNRFNGAVLAIHKGAVNDEVELMLDGSNTKLTAIITSVSTKTLGLEPGKKVVALIKASWVILFSNVKGFKFSARNHLQGTVVSVDDGAVNSEVRVRLDGGEALTAVITKESVKNLGLEVGCEVTALVKASHVILGVPE